MRVGFPQTWALPSAPRPNPGPEVAEVTQRDGAGIWGGGGGALGGGSLGAPADPSVCWEEWAARSAATPGRRNRGPAADLAHSFVRSFVHSTFLH